MTATLSKTQVDRLGDRLRKGAHSERDLRLLDDYRRSFGEAYESVFRTLRERLQHHPTGRPAKSTGSIVEKLRRESIRLSQMQDIAGCRVVVADVLEQEHSVALLRTTFLGATVIDRRENPSHGYRAVHIVPEISGMPIEIQVRTSLQHMWAELSEKSSDVVDPMIKYGGGPALWQTVLAKTSQLVARYEEGERLYSEAFAAIERLEGRVAKLVANRETNRNSQEIKETLHDLTLRREEMRKEMEVSQRMAVDLLSDMISLLDNRPKTSEKP